MSNCCMISHKLGQPFLTVVSNLNPSSITPLSCWQQSLCTAVSPEAMCHEILNTMFQRLMTFVVGFHGVDSKPVQ